MERAESGLARVVRSRWAAVGRSAHPDAATAAHEAARAALDGQGEPGLLLVFASGAYDLPVLTAGINEFAAGIPLVGCTSAGEIDASGPASGSVVVLALGGEGFSFSVATVTGAEPREAGARVAACIGDVADRPHRVLLLLTDGPAAIHADVVRGAYSVAGAGVPLVGGVAGHPSHGPGEGQGLIYGSAVLHDAVAGVAIGSDAPLGVGVRHGWQPIGEPMLVTRAEPGRIVELDDRPAAEVYRERLGGVLDDDVVLGHPLGLQPRAGEAHARSVTLDGAQDGSINCAVPQGALVWLMEGATDAVLEAAGAACADALAALGGAAPTALIPFDCVARLRYLGDDLAAEEVTRIAGHAAGAPIAGLYTNGEIARTRGIVGYHQQTFVVLAVA
jgi:hypothetical protein